MADYPVLKESESPAIVYVRTVRTEDLPDDVKSEAGGLPELYAVANSEGQVLALVDDRDRAFTLARMNELVPVSVH